MHVEPKTRAGGLRDAQARLEEAVGLTAAIGLTVTQALVAPLGLNQRVGTLKVTTSGGAPVAEVPLVVQHEVPLAGIFGRAWDAIRLWIK